MHNDQGEVIRYNQFQEKMIYLEFSSGKASMVPSVSTFDYNPASPIEKRFIVMVLEDITKQYIAKWWFTLVEAANFLEFSSAAEAFPSIPDR